MVGNSRRAQCLPFPIRWTRACPAPSSRAFGLTRVRRAWNCRTLRHAALLLVHLQHPESCRVTTWWFADSDSRLHGTLCQSVSFFASQHVRTSYICLAVSAAKLGNRLDCIRRVQEQAWQLVLWPHSRAKLVRPGGDVVAPLDRPMPQLYEAAMSWGQCVAANS